MTTLDHQQTGNGFMKSVIETGWAMGCSIVAAGTMLS